MRRGWMSHGRMGRRSGGCQARKRACGEGEGGGQREGGCCEGAGGGEEESASAGHPIASPPRRPLPAVMIHDEHELSPLELGLEPA